MENGRSVEAKEINRGVNDAGLQGASNLAEDEERERLHSVTGLALGKRGDDVKHAALALHNWVFLPFSPFGWNATYVLPILPSFSLALIHQIRGNADTSLSEDTLRLARKESTSVALNMDEVGAGKPKMMREEEA
ncbi:hypothetical protein RJT34_31896 [Clitoria ternatea]|uniref:Uncharacterized protein n=1 Tax=Clitoria ternatea TaxID=43366 RepID=A0AAN9EWD2_CLITE